MSSSRFNSLCRVAFLTTLLGQLICGDGANILGLFINSHRSHLLVYTALVEALLERGHNVTIVTTLNIPRTLMANNSTNLVRLRHIQLDAKIHKHGSNEVGSKQKLEQMLERIKATSLFLEDSQWQTFMEEPQKYDLMLLGYLFNDYQLGVAAHFGCPSIIIWTGQPIGFVHILMGNPEERWYVPQPYDSHQYIGWKGMLFGAFEWLVEYMALQVMQQIYDAHFPSHSYPSFDVMRQNVSLALLNHHTVSEGPAAPYVPAMIDIGGIQNKKIVSTKLPERLLKSSKPNEAWIYISLGTRVLWQTLPGHTLQLFTQVITELSPTYKIIWTFDGNCSDLEQNNSHIFCSSWWPQATILAQPQTKLFITHGGKGSIAEALHHAVPMLGVPIFGDQRANIAKLVNSGVALQADLVNLTKWKLKRAILSILENSSFHESMKQFSQRYLDRPLSAQENAIFWMEYVLRHKGAAHLRSPLVFLSIWQIHNIDIYAFLLAAFGATFYFFNSLERILNLQ